MSTRYMQQSEEDFRNLAENSPDVIDRFDRSCRHLYVNAAGLRQLSLPAERVVGRTVRETGVPEPFCSQWEARASHVFRTAEPLEVSDVFPGPNGLTYFNSRCVPEFDASGEVRSVLVISRDITERKKMEDDLRRNQADLAEAQRLARLGNWTRSVADSGVRWSRELFGVFDLDEWGESGSYDIVLQRVHPDDREMVRQVNAAALEAAKSFVMEYRIVTRAGEVRHIREIGYARKNEAGEVVELFGSAQDISESKAAEESLRKWNDELECRVKKRTAKLRELAQEITRVEQKERRRIADVLHEDVQQVLVGVRFKLEHLREGEGPSEKGQALDWVLHHLKIAHEMIRSLTVRLRPQVLYDLGLKAAVEWLAGEMKDKFDLRVEVEGDEPSLTTPSEEIKAFAFSAVSELLMNVVKHAAVKRARVELAMRSDGVLAVTVSDQGVGFNCTCPPKACTFGLFGMRERAETFGGQLKVSSAPGCGTRAELTIPLE